MKMWANKRLDASLADWWFGLRHCLGPGLTDAATDVARGWSPAGDAMVGLSVRSLFDLWLSAQGWEAGDRIVFTAFTVADMPFVARAHGLEVATLDIDPLSGEPDLEQLPALVNERTRAVVYTHLFGAQGRAELVQQVAKNYGLAFVEDCAEAYAGSSWRGHPDSDVSLFSFGPIKTATAFGGGLASVSDPSLRDEMLRLEAQRPQQSWSDYLQRLLKFGALGAATNPWVFAMLVRVLDLFGPGYDESLQRLTRGFPGPELLARIRRRPHPAMVALLGRRLSEGEARVRQRADLARYLVAGLEGVRVPTSSVSNHAYWLVPVLADDPQGLVQKLSAAGFHATRGRSFAVVEHDSAVVGPEPLGARTLFDQVVFLPFAAEMPTPVLDVLASTVRRELTGD